MTCYLTVLYLAYSFTQTLPGERISYGTPAGYPEAKTERYREVQP